MTRALADFYDHPVVLELGDGEYETDTVWTAGLFLGYWLGKHLGEDETESVRQQLLAELDKHWDDDPQTWCEMFCAAEMLTEIRKWGALVDAVYA